MKKKGKTKMALFVAALILFAALIGIFLAGGRRSDPDSFAVRNENTETEGSAARNQGTKAGASSPWNQSAEAGSSPAQNTGSETDHDSAGNTAPTTPLQAAPPQETPVEKQLPDPAPAGNDTLPDEHAIPQTPDEDSISLVCRIVDGADTGNLLLASQNDTADIYMLNINRYPLTAQSSDFEKLENGMLLQITYDGMILETYPAQFGNIQEILVLDYGTDNLSELYLDVLNDLWETDPGLNSNITELGVDLSQTQLSGSEQAAVAWAFGNCHGLSAIQGNIDELSEMGYIDKKFRQWENGCLFSITEQTLEGIYNANVISFDAQKWRSGDGAYFFMDCSSVQSSLGIWDGYSIGAQAIS